jgi:uncharacterized membrane protein
MYLILKWLHILSAIIAVGANATYIIWLRLAGQEQEAKPFVFRGLDRLESMTLPFYILLFLSGLGMLFVSGLPWTTPWVLSGIVGFVAMAFLGARVFGPALRQMRALADTPESPEYQALEERNTRILVIVLLLAVLVEYLMTAKPALWR